MIKFLRRLYYTLRGFHKDELGYWRNQHGMLIHRMKAYNKLYTKYPDEYPLPFSLYEVHHIDKDKENNSLNNLSILTPDEHDFIHSPRRYDTTFRPQLSHISYN